MTFLATLWTDLTRWQRLQLSWRAWVLIIGLGSTLVPALAGMSLMATSTIIELVAHGAVREAAVFPMLMVGFVFGFLYGVVPAACALLIAVCASAAVRYTNLHIVLVSAGSTTLLAAALLLRGLPDMVLALVGAVLVIVTLLWTLLRTFGLGQPRETTPV